MKLITKINLNFISISIFILLASSFAFYFLLRITVSENINNQLLNTRQLLNIELNNIQNKLQEHAHSNDESKIIIKPISEIKSPNPSFVDTILYNHTSKKYQLYRQLTYQEKFDTNNYEVRILKSHQFTDRLILEMLTIISTLIIALFISLYITNKYIMKKSWSAFYKTIDRLRTFDVNHGEQILFENTEITEFQDLNKAIGSMTNKIQEDFVNLKEYTENTSHEIQTPLAIINLKIESLLQFKSQVIDYLN